jgi:hypothetical protein
MPFLIGALSLGSRALKTPCLQLIMVLAAVSSAIPILAKDCSVETMMRTTPQWRAAALGNEFCELDLSLNRKEFEPAHRTSITSSKDTKTAGVIRSELL